jgi:hypothetical protein
MFRQQLSLALLVIVGFVYGSAARPLAAPKLEPIVYTISFPDPASKTFNVDAIVPTEKHASVELMMAISSPGFYGVRNYAAQVSGFAAKSTDGAALDVTKIAPG